MKNTITYRVIETEELIPQFFEHFIRHQVVTDCWRKRDGKWCIENEPFIDDWSADEFEFLIKCLCNTKKTGGLVYGVFSNDQLKGFTSVESKPLGSEQQYRDLSSIHVSEDMRGCGIGKQLFLAASKWAKEHGGKKLYISAHSAVESQAFYKAMGCVEALEYNQKHVEQEPCDCQLECVLTK